MKNKNNSNSFIAQMKITTSIILMLMATFSCRSTDVEGEITPKGQSAVHVSIEDDIFEESVEIGNKASTSKSLSSSAATVQQNTVAFDDDFYIVAELTQESNAVVGHAAKASQQNNNTIAQTTNLNPNIRYKIVVYNNSGVYITEKDYVRGQEASPGPLILDGGMNYTFIVYSINSTTVLPSVTFVNPANKTLATSSVNVTGIQDFMYFRKDMTVSGDNTNYLGVILKHQFSQITTTVDATATGYNITAITSVISPQHNPNANIALANATITRSGTPTTLAVTFPTLGTQTVVGTPNIINAAANINSSYIINSITVGPLTATNITPLSNLAITPGAKYNMKINIVPTDAFITHQGLPAVRINGQIWMRHNLGVNTALDPDQTPITSALHGNYYQFGRITSVSSGTATTVSNYNNNNNPGNAAWNTNNGTALPPVKTANDPCPTGYRVPTQPEMQQLIDDVTASTAGT
ncbi:fibrobacter succinogenes major paralogous domain-containing protein [Sphingobacterium sp. KU25419]|nr:fibrobacter succinogenes major paralogous domain-containing protein [Sphingobacterium sp. KU25419]